MRDPHELSSIKGGHCHNGKLGLLLLLLLLMFLYFLLLLLLLWETGRLELFFPKYPDICYTSKNGDRIHTLCERSSDVIHSPYRWLQILLIFIGNILLLLLSTGQESQKW